MLKIVCVVDKTGTALDRLAKGVAKYHNNLNYVVCDVHPKRPDPEQLARFEREAIDADIIDWQYYRTAELLKLKYPWLESKKQILTHNNPYSIEESSWNNYDLNIGNNQYIYERLGKITDKPVDYIPLCVDTDFWEFNLDWKFEGRVDKGHYEFKNEQDKPTVIMVANRIESKKGILPVAIACNELNIHFILVGSISDGNYFHAIQASGNVEFHEKISDEKLRELYCRSTVHVCNSQDNFESGTLPILEAMLCGVPVLTRNVGHVPELNNGENMVIYDGDPENVLEIQEKLLDMISDKEKLKDIRDKAWQTAKSRSFERRAYTYQRAYRDVMWPDQQSVSVVVPVYDKPDVVRKCLNAIAEQTHKNIEIIVASDTKEMGMFDLVKEFARFVDIPVMFILTADNKDGYGLARARNEATIEATGEVIVYCDQRMIMEPNAVEEFLKRLASRTWLYGNKGGKKSFVENFSCVYRDRVIQSGMFCERITGYGGMSEEIRKRLNRQGVETVYVESAKATPTGKSSNRNRKRQEIIRMKNRTWKMYG